MTNIKKKTRTFDSKLNLINEALTIIQPIQTKPFYKTKNCDIRIPLITRQQPFKFWLPIPNTLRSHQKQ